MKTRNENGRRGGESALAHALTTLRAVGILIGLALGGVAGCDQAGGDVAALPDAAAPEVDTAPVAEPKPAAAPVTTGAPSGPPRIEFESTTYDFGRVAETSTHKGQLTFANTGGSTLVISEIKTTCGCTAVALEKRQYAPGESGTLEIEFNPVAPGDQKKYINVLSNADGGGFTRLMMVADVIAFLDLQPRKLELEGLQYRQEHRATVTATCPDPLFTIDSVTTSNPRIRAEVTGFEGDTRTIEVTVDAVAPWGGLFSWLTVTVTGRPTPESAPISHSSKVRIQGSIFGELTAEPHTFRFGAKPSEVFVRTIQLKRPDGVPFRVLDATVTTTDLPNASVEAKQVAPNIYDLVLTATAGTIRKSYRGTVQVRTDVGGEATVQLPISGVVRDQARGVK